MHDSAFHVMQQQNTPMKKTIVYALEDQDGMPFVRQALTDFGIDFVPVYPLDAPASRPALACADVLLVALQPVTPQVMDAMPKCRLISRLGVGVDNIDVPAATARGIWVANVPDYGTDEVSTHAIALILAQLRGLPQLINETRAGKWDGLAAAPFTRLTQLTLGVMGFGRIGSATARKAIGLGMRVIAHDPFVNDDVIRTAGVEPVDQDALFKEADVVSLHLPLNASTRGIINARLLKLMKPSAYLVNTARGGVIHEADLLDALNAGLLRGAALDVLSAEPPPADHALLQALIKHPRIIMTPHMGWYSEQGRRDMHAFAGEDIARFLRGEPLRTPVNDVAGHARSLN
jgi:D-3-phosphoglycerate dehydrogenase